MKIAIHCIPEFNGNSDELEPFLLQIDHFSTNIPEGVTQDILLNIVLMKLKGNAVTFINRIRSDTWAEMKPKLQRLFRKTITTEELFQKIETLEQNQNESFREYVEKALKIKEYIQALRPQEAAIMEENLAIHFIGGLTNQNLKQTATSQRTNNFDDLIQLLNYVYKKCEQVRRIENTLQSCRLTKNLHDSNNELEQLKLSLKQKQEDLANLTMKELKIKISLEEQENLNTMKGINDKLNERNKENISYNNFHEHNDNQRNFGTQLFGNNQNREYHGKQNNNYSINHIQNNQDQHNVNNNYNRGNFNQEKN